MFFYGMISNELNLLDGTDTTEKILKKVGNRIKTLRMSGGNWNYEKFAFKNNIDRMLLRRCELGESMNFVSLLKIIKALDIPISEFFNEGMD